MASDASLGPLIRLSGIPTAKLPAPNASPEELAPLLQGLLKEAVPFIDSAGPKSSSEPSAKLWKHKADKSSPHMGGKVEVSERIISASDLAAIAAHSGAAEYWMCRRSVHEDAAAPGTATWAEFERCFRDEHAESEEAFTPNVVEGAAALTWDCGAVGPVALAGETWSRFSLRVQEMRHKVGRPALKDRTFVVLMMTAAVVGRDEFLIVSVPVPDFGGAEASRLARKPGALVARYISVERIRRLDDGRHIEWLMATASDAGGVLPQWLQNLSMPGVVWKDVTLFTRWIQREREKVGAPKDGTGE